MIVKAKKLDEFAYTFIGKQGKPVSVRAFVEAIHNKISASDHPRPQGRVKTSHGPEHATLLGSEDEYVTRAHK